MIRLISFIAFAVFSFATFSVAAEDGPARWSEPLEGVENLLVGSDLGVLIVTPVDDEASQSVAELLRDKLIETGIVDVVMDDSPLGDLSGRSDDEIVEMARKYPVDIVFVVRAFPGREGVNAVMRVEMLSGGGNSFRLSPQSTTEFQPSLPSQPSLSSQPSVKEEPAQPDAGEEHARRRARDLSAMVRSSAVGVTESVRLVRAEGERKKLYFEESGSFGAVVDTDGERVEWGDVYGRIGDEELHRSWKTRRTIRTASFVSGGILAVAGAGLLFVSLGNVANCSDLEDQSECSRPTLLGASVLALGLGAIGIVTGAVVSPHPIEFDELRRRIEQQQ